MHALRIIKRLPVFLIALHLAAACAPAEAPAPEPLPPSELPTAAGVGATTDLAAPFEHVILHAGIDVSEGGQVPDYILRVGEGHTLLYVIETRQLIYDAATIYTGDLAGLYGDGFGLSRNGLHHAYFTVNSEDPAFRDLYVDGVKIASGQHFSRPAVSDDGQQHLYVACVGLDGAPDTCLFKNGENILLHASGILGYQISRDGSSYLASLRNFDANGAFVESLAWNGQEVFRGGERMAKLLSPDGRHYAHAGLDTGSGLQSVVVDGVTVKTSTAMHLQQLTDQGAYCGWDAAGRTVFVNGRELPVTSESQIRCFINADGSRMLLQDRGWLLDGTPIPVEDAVTAEFVGDRLYVYSVIE